MANQHSNLGSNLPVNQKQAIQKRLDEGPIAIVILCLIVLSLVTFSIETLPNLSPAQRKLTEYIEFIIVFFFTLEYLTRIMLARSRYIFSFFGLVDLLSIAPFFIAIALGVNDFDIWWIRIFRLVRIFKIFKFPKYSKAIKRFNRAFRIAKEELIVFGMIVLILLYVSAVGIYHFEHNEPNTNFQSVIHSLWWALITLTTVGYGDMAPVTAGGKFFTFIMLMIGLAIVAIPTGLISSALLQIRREDESHEPQHKNKHDKDHNH